jgi:hypothetical protein
MRFVPQINAPPRKNLNDVSRIEAIKKPLKGYIRDNVKKDDTLRIYTFSKPVELYQEEEKGLFAVGKKKFSNQSTLIINQFTNLDNDRKSADEFVDNMHKIIGRSKSRPTHLYESMDRILSLATGLIKEGKKVSVLIISDGADSTKGKPLADMGAVMKKHNTTITNLTGKTFCKIVKFDLGKDGKDLVGAGFTVAEVDLTQKDPELPPVPPVDPPKPKITIEALFEVKLNKTAVKPGDVKWIHEKPLVFTLIDQTIAKKMGKVQDADQKEEILKYAWSFDPKTKIRPDRNQEPNKVSLGQGDHEINLTVSDITKGENKDKAKTLNFTIKEVKIDAAIVEAQDGTLKIMQGGKVDFKFKGMPPNTVIKWDYGDGEFGEVPEHTYQDPSEPGKKGFEVKVEITLPAGEEFTHRLGFVQVTKASAHAFAKPDNPWPGQKVIFDLDSTKVDLGKVVKVTWHFGVEDVNGKEPNVAKTGPNKFSFQDTFDEPGEVKVFAKIKLKGLKQEPEAKANIVVREVLPKIVVTKTDLFVGEETKYTITQADGTKFPADFDFKAEVILPAGAGGVIKKPEEMIYFAKAGEHKVGVKITPTYPKGFKGVEKAFDNKIEDAAELTVKEIKIEIGVKKAKE